MERRPEKKLKWGYLGFLSETIISPLSQLVNIYLLDFVVDNLNQNPTVTTSAKMASPLKESEIASNP